MRGVEFRWARAAAKIAAALAVAIIIPACADGEDGTDGADGADGAGVANPPAAWSAPVNLSNQVPAYDESAYGTQAVFSSDGRMHVAYYGYNPDNDSDQIFYTTSTAPYDTWSTPVLVSQSDYTPDVFDLTAGEDGTAQIAFARYFFNGMTDTTEIVHVANTPGALLTFTETQVFVDTAYTDSVNSVRILMQGSVAHLVWGQYDGEYDDYYYSNSAVAGGWPTLAPTLVDAPNRDIYAQHYTFSKDSSGRLHFAYYYDNGVREVRYRSIAPGAGAFGTPQSVSDSSNSTITIEDGPPAVQFDGSNNVFVFYKRWNAASAPYRAIMMNSKSAAGVFTASNEVAVTESPNTDEIRSFGSSYDWIGVVDMQVTSAGAVHAAWKGESSSFATGGYPIYYRYKAAGVNPQSGWNQAEVADFGTNPNSNSTDEGARRSVFVRPSANGDVHVFHAVSAGFGPPTVSLMHSYKADGESNFRSGGSVSGPTNIATYVAGTNSQNFIVDAGVDENGLPYVLMETFFFSSFNTATLSYTHRWANQWIAGVDVDGVNPIGTDGGTDLWAGHDPDGRLHVIWPQTLDPYNTYAEDLMHSMTPVKSQTFWTRTGSLDPFIP